MFKMHCGKGAEGYRFRVYKRNGRQHLKVTSQSIYGHFEEKFLLNPERIKRLQKIQRETCNDEPARAMKVFSEVVTWSIPEGRRTEVRGIEAMLDSMARVSAAMKKEREGNE